MKKRYFFPSILLTATVLLSACTASKTAGTPAASGDGAAADALAADLAYLTSDGCDGRLVGSAGNALAGDYIGAAFTEAGLSFLPSREGYALPYRQQVYDPDQTNQTLTVTHADGSAAEYTAGVDFLPYLGASVEGTVAADGDAFVIEPAAEAGVSVSLTSDANATYSYGTLFISRPLRLPDAILATLEPGDALTVNAISTTDATVNNLAGVLAGADRSRALVITSHYDHMGHSGGAVYRGALDNAAGVSTMLEILRRSAERGAGPVDLVFCAFNGEESHLAGSAAFIEAGVLDGYDEVNVINLDTVGAAGCSTWLIGEETALADQLAAALTEAGLACTVGPYGSSDHQSFLAAGIAAANVSSEEYGLTGETPKIHVPTDTADQIDLAQLDALAGALTDYCYSGAALAQPEPQPDPGADMTEVLYQQMARGGTPEPGRVYTAVYDGTTYAAAYYPPCTDRDAWNSDYPALALPEQLGGYAWTRAVVGGFADLAAEQNPTLFLTFAPLAEGMNPPDALGAPDPDRLLTSAAYTDDDGNGFLLIFRPAGSPAYDVDSAYTAGETVTVDGFSLTPYYTTSDETPSTYTWQDPDTGRRVEIQPLRFYNPVPAADELPALLAEYLAQAAA